MNKQIILCSYNGIWLNNEKDKLLIDTIWVNLKIISLWEKYHNDRVYIVWFYTYKVLENPNYSDGRYQWLPEEQNKDGRGRRKGLQKGTREVWGVMDSLLIVTWVHKYIKNYQIVHFTRVLFFYANETSVKKKSLTHSGDLVKFGCIEHTQIRNIQNLPFPNYFPTFCCHLCSWDYCLHLLNQYGHMWYCATFHLCTIPHLLIPCW